MPMASSARQKTTFAKLNREATVRERRLPQASPEGRPQGRRGRGVRGPARSRGRDRRAGGFSGPVEPPRRGLELLGLAALEVAAGPREPAHAERARAAVRVIARVVGLDFLDRAPVVARDPGLVAPAVEGASAPGEPSALPRSTPKCVSPAVPPLNTVKTASTVSSAVTSPQRTRSTFSPKRTPSSVSLPARRSACWMLSGSQTGALAAALAGRRTSAARAMRRGSLVTARV